MIEVEIAGFRTDTKINDIKALCAMTGLRLLESKWIIESLTNDYDGGDNGPSIVKLRMSFERYGRFCLVQHNYDNTYNWWVRNVREVQPETPNYIVVPD